MITGFEQQTHELTREELELVPQFIKGLKTHYGKKNAVKSSDIIKGFKKQGITITPPRVRKIINYIRVKRLVEGVCATSNGYYVAQTEMELQSYIKSLSERIQAQQAVLRSLVVNERDYLRGVDMLKQDEDSL